MQADRRLLKFYALPLGVAACLWVMVAWVIAQRWAYPYQIEWIEGSVLHHVVRILQGQALYAYPDMTYAPALYTPLYYYAGAALSALTEPGLPALRLVSILASLLASGAIGGMTWLLTRSRLAVGLALLLAAMPFRYTAMWFDVARVDSLWASLLVATVYCLYRARPVATHSLAWCLGSATLFAMAVMTKQTSLFLVPFLFASAWCWVGLRYALWAGVTAGALLAAFATFFNLQSGGLFWFFTMEMAGSHEMTRGFPLHFFKGDLLESVPVFLVLGACGVHQAWRQHRPIGLGWLALLLGVFAMTLLARMYAGGARNVTLPMHWLLVPMAVAGFHGLLARLAGWRSGAVCALMVANTVWSGFVPQWAVPTEADRAYGDALVRRIAAVPGRVCSSRDAYLVWMAGKEFCAHETQLTDILNGGNATLATAVVEDARARILGGYYEVLILDNLFDIGNYVNPFQIPYIGEPLDLEESQMQYFNPVNGGPRPHLWMQLVPERATSPVGISVPDQ